MSLQSAGVGIAALVALLFWSGAAWALAPVRVVVEGQAAADTAGASGRTAALEDGLSRAVEKVAFDLIESDGGNPDGLVALEVLGGKSTDYAVRYRVLADRGVSTASGAYTLEIEAHVDVDRVALGLQAAGLLKTLPGELPTRAFRVIVETRDWAAYSGFVKAVKEHGGARSAIPESFSEGRAVLRVESPGQPDELLRRLLRARIEPLRVDALSSEGGDIRVQVAWQPTEEAP